MAPKHEYNEEKEEQKPKDKADRLAEQYEDQTDHTKGGHNKTAPSHQSKPSSVRNS